MAIEVIDGVLTPAEPFRRKRGYTRYKELRIAAADGTERTLAKVAAGGVMVDEIARGGRGRWFVTTADGALGLYGVRRPDGAAHYGHFTNMEPFVLVGAIIGLVALLARLLFGEGPLLAAVLGPPLLLAWFYLRHQRLAAKSAFDAAA